MALAPEPAGAAVARVPGVLGVQPWLLGDRPQGSRSARDAATDLAPKPGGAPVPRVAEMLGVQPWPWRRSPLGYPSPVSQGR